MIGFGLRLLVLTGGATAIAVGIVLLSSGFVTVPLVEPSYAGAITGLALLIFSLVVAGWYESGADEVDV